MAKYKITLEIESNKTTGFFMWIISHLFKTDSLLKHKATGTIEVDLKERGLNDEADYRSYDKDPGKYRDIVYQKAKI